MPDPVTDPQPPRPDDSRWCLAKTKGGPGYCHRPAGWGTPHPGIGRCTLHGGASPNAIRGAEKVLAQQRVAKAVEVANAFGIGIAPGHVDPFEEILISLWRRKVALRYIEGEVGKLRAEEVVWVKAEEDTATEQVAEVGTGTGAAGGDTAMERKTDEARIRRRAEVNAWVRLWQEVQRDHDRLAVEAVRLGLAEREVRVTELLGGQMYDVLQAIFADPALAMTPDQLERVPEVASRHLELVPA